MNLHQLTLFIQVVQDGSFTAAARSLHLPKSAVSAAVARLEADLGVLLLNRTSRKVGLTEEGAALFAHASPPLEALRESEQLVREMRSALRGRIRITAPAGLGTQILDPVVSPFLLKHPETCIDVVFTMRKLDLVGEGFDLALRAGDLVDDDVVAKSLGTGFARLYAAPDFLASRAPIASLADLHGQDFVVLGSGERARDELTLDGTDGTQTIAIKRRLSSDHFPFALRAVLNGAGIGLLPESLCHDVLASGALVPVLPAFSLPGKPIYLVYPRNRYLPRRVMALRDAILGAELHDKR